MILREGSTYFYNNNHIKIKLQDLKTIKKLKSKRKESSYIDNVMVWENTTNDISLILNLYARLCKIPSEFIFKYNIKKYHIALIRRMYIDFEDSEKQSYMSFKRPYGNSNIIGDVAEEYIKSEKINDVNDDWEDDNYTLLIGIHNQVMDIFDLMLKELMLNSTEYVTNNRSNLNNWKPTKLGTKEIVMINRVKKLKRILKEE